MSTHIFTSESVSEGHPDKVCDQVSDAVLDTVFAEDPEARVACECFAATGMIVVGGEIRTSMYIDLPEVVRGVIRDIGYTDPALRFDAESCAVINVINRQSDDIAMGVDTGGAGDQGMMFGYACGDTDELMPAPIYYSHQLVKRLADIRKSDPVLMPYLRPDAKAQVTVEYSDSGEIVSIPTIVVSTQHAEHDSHGKDVTQQRIKEDVIENVIKAVIPEHLITDATTYHINPTGRFVIGGPHGDTGLTGRKIIVDTYGGRAPHGGGAFSGKDPTKVDRSAAYAARHLAKNLVAAGVGRECTIQLAYAIGVAEPVSILVDSHGTAAMPDHEIASWISAHVALTPDGIIRRLNLRRPIYRPTAAYGHFGRHQFPWEHLDLVEAFRTALA
ncbi:MAG: methionine adenosyltransferase [Candidatus Kapaibacteriota bacterium]